MENSGNINNNQAPNELADQWKGMDIRQNPPKDEADTLSLFSEVGYGGYKISSSPFDSKSEAYDEIRENWQGADVTTHFHNGKWYIVSK